MTKLIKYFPLMLLVFSINTNAEIHKETIKCEKSEDLCFYWWPKLPNIDGWKQDKQYSFHYSMNAQVPIESNFKDAESVIYANAIYKQGEIEDYQLGQFIDYDKKRFSEKYENLIIKKLEPMKSKNGLIFASYSFTPNPKGNWELVSYSEEQDKDKNDYFIVFVLSSRSEAGFKKSLNSYREFIANYE